jgi:hypothetical protein
VHVGTADPDCPGAKCERLHYVGAGTDAGVEEDRHVRHRLGHVSEAVDGGQAAVGLPAGKFEVDKSRGRQPMTQVSRVTTIAR